jgi:hypothetical protein
MPGEVVAARGDEGCPAIRDVAMKLPRQRRATVRIDSGSGVVEQEYAGSVHDRTCQRDTTKESAARFPHLEPRDRDQAHAFEHLGRGNTSFRP